MRDHAISVPDDERAWSVVRDIVSNPSLSPTAKIIYLRFVVEEGLWPAVHENATMIPVDIAEMASTLGVHYDQTLVYVRQLVDAGLIRREIYHRGRHGTLVLFGAGRRLGSVEVIPEPAVLTKDRERKRQKRAVLPGGAA